MATTNDVQAEEEVRELSWEEGWALLEERAQRRLHMSADEFLRKWDAHEFENPDTPDVMYLAMLIPFVRQNAV